MLEKITSYFKKERRDEDPFEALETKRGSVLTKLNGYLDGAIEKFKKGDVAEKAKVGAVAGGLLGTAIVTGFPGYMVIVLGMTAGAIGKELYDDYASAMKTRGETPESQMVLEKKVQDIRAHAKEELAQAA